MTRKVGILLIAGIFLQAVPRIQAAIVFYLNDNAGFSTAMNSQFFYGKETFEEGIYPGSDTELNSPLTLGVPNTAAFPSGINEHITISTTSRIFLVGAGSHGLLTNVVASGGLNNPLLYTFNVSDKISGVGFDLVQFDTAGTVQIAAYNTTGALMGAIIMPGDSVGSNFLGLGTTGGELLGRIEIGGIFTGSNNGGADNIRLFSSVPEPSGVLLVSLGIMSLSLLRRRRTYPLFACRNRSKLGF